MYYYRCVHYYIIKHFHKTEIKKHDEGNHKYPIANLVELSLPKSE